MPDSIMWPYPRYMDYWPYLDWPEALAKLEVCLHHVYRQHLYSSLSESYSSLLSTMADLEGLGWLITKWIFSHQSISYKLLL